MVTILLSSVYRRALVRLIHYPAIARLDNNNNIIILKINIPYSTARHSNLIYGHWVASNFVLVTSKPNMYRQKIAAYFIKLVLLFAIEWANEKENERSWYQMERVRGIYGNLICRFSDVNDDCCRVFIYLLRMGNVLRKQHHLLNYFFLLSFDKSVYSWLNHLETGYKCKWRWHKTHQQ